VWQRWFPSSWRGTTRRRAELTLLSLKLRESDAAGKTLTLDVEKPGSPLGTCGSIRGGTAAVAADAAPLAVRLDPGARLTLHPRRRRESLPEVTVEILQGDDRHRSPVSRDGSSASPASSPES